MTRTSLMALVLLVSACIWVPPIWDAEDEIYLLDIIEPGVTTKDQVLAELGKPDGSSKTDHGTRFLYRGHKSKGVLVGLPPAAGIVDPQEWTVDLEFDDNDTVCRVSTSEGLTPNAKAAYATWKAEAEAGDAEAQYEFSSRVSSRAQAYKWLCLAAHQSHPIAQHKIGSIYQQRDHPYYQQSDLSADEDLVRAYLWYKLAENNGFQKEAFTYIRANGAWRCKQFKNHREWVKSLMTPVQTSHAERLVAEWKPNPADCAQTIGNFRRQLKKACMGDRLAQYSVAQYYASGEGAERDKVQAFKWYSLSEAQWSDADQFFGDAIQYIKKELRQGMTASEITEAERLATEWKPNQAGCDTKSVRASD